MWIEFIMIAKGGKLMIGIVCLMNHLTGDELLMDCVESAVLLMNLDRIIKR